MEKDYSCIIPRNLDKPDTLISFGKIKISQKQATYVLVGAATCWYLYTLDISPIVKIAGSVISLQTGLVLAFAKYRNINIDKLVVDGFVYSVRKSHYKKLERKGELVVTIKAKEERSSVTTKQATFCV